MRQYLMYIVAPSEMEKIKVAMRCLDAKEIPSSTPKTESFEVKHSLIGSMALVVTLLSDLEYVSLHMRHNPIDLLIFDERGDNWRDALEAMSHIKHDMRQLGDQWGPDFYFPMTRSVAILKGASHQTDRTFALGRLGVRDLLVEPRSAAQVLRWIKEVIQRGIARENRVGVALSGGGLEGFLWQLGTLYALERAMRGGRTLVDADIISGVSSGALSGSTIAGNANIGELIRSFHGNGALYPTFTSQMMFDIAGTNIVRRIVKELISWGINPTRWPTKVLRAIPTGFFKGEQLESFMHQVMLASAGHDEFDKLSKEFYVGATDQDSYEHVTFGVKPWDKMAISEALRASCSFPPIFTPKAISGRRYIDGQVTNSCNLEIVAERGARLIFVIDPLKPTTTAQAGTIDEYGGLFGTIQTIKALVSTRFEQSLQHLSATYPDVDFIVLQPDEESARLMSGSPMRYRIRTQLIETAYRGTLLRLRERYNVYSVKMSRYGFHLRSPQKLKELEGRYAEVLKSTAKRHA